jgi:hypothetical protein
MENRTFKRFSRESVVEELSAAASALPDEGVLKRRKVIQAMMPYIDNFYRITTPAMRRPFYFVNEME